MIDADTLTLFVLGAMALVISPGPDFVYVTTRGIAQGRRAGLLSAAGIGVGILVHTTLAALGLAALVAASPLLFQAIKVAGAAYLVFLGVKSLLAKDSLLRDGPVEQASAGVLFRDGVMTNVLNPRAVITFLAFLPQFVNAGAGSATLQTAVLGGMLALMCFGWFSLVGLFAGTLGGLLAKSVRLATGVRWFTGAVLIGLGVRLALARRG